MNAEREVVDMKVIKNLISKYALMLAVPILLFVVLSIIFHGVIGTNNIPSLMQQAVAPAILGWGVLFNIKVGNWDFSVGSVVLLSAIIGGNIELGICRTLDFLSVSGSTGGSCCRSRILLFENSDDHYIHWYASYL